MKLYRVPSIMLLLSKLSPAFRQSFQEAFNTVASNSATLKLVNIGDEDKIDSFNNASVVKFKDYWDKHKSSEYDMALFNYLIGTSASA